MDRTESRRSVSLAPLAPRLRHTATFDNGKAFADRQRIAQATAIDIYFDRLYHAWEGGSNESCNGLLRQFLPKWTDFTGDGPLAVKQVLHLPVARQL